MTKEFITFIIRLAIFTVVFALIGFSVAYFIPAEYISPTLPFQYVFFTAVTLLFHLFLLRSKSSKGSQFSRHFMLGTFLKLILYLIIITVYSLIYREDAVSFIISFFILYLCYSAFEVIQIMAINSKVLPRI